MGKTVKGSAQLIKGLNTSLVLDVIRRRGPLSRSAIARRTGISNPAVSTLIHHLVERGVVEEVGKAPSTGGRPAHLLRFNPRAGYLIGVDVGAQKITGGVVDLGGEIVTRLSTKTVSPVRATSRLIALIGNLIDASQVVPDRIWGIGLGVPGVTDPMGQSITLIPGLEWDNLNVGQILTEHFSVPVWADNDANAAVLGERWRGALEDVEYGLCVNIGTGIGVGLLLDGQVYRGKMGAAGEVGYWVFREQALERQGNGFGHLESFAAGPGIARRAAEYLADTNGAESRLKARGLQLTAKDVFEAAAQGDPAAVAIVNETTEVLGSALANMCTLLDVERVVLTGGVSSAGEMLLQPIRRIVQAVVPYPPEVIVSRMQEDAGILGCAAGVMEQRTNHIRFSTLG